MCLRVGLEIRKFLPSGFATTVGKVLRSENLAGALQINRSESTLSVDRRAKMKIRVKAAVLLLTITVESNKSIRFVNSQKIQVWVEGMRGIE
jgi:hypothetical protein